MDRKWKWCKTGNKKVNALRWKHIFIDNDILMGTGNCNGDIPPTKILNLQLKLSTIFTRTELSEKSLQRIIYQIILTSNFREDFNYFSQWETNISHSNQIFCWIKSKCEISVEDFPNNICNKLQIIWTCNSRDDYLNFYQSESRIVYGIYVFPRIHTKGGISVKDLTYIIDAN